MSGKIAFYSADQRLYPEDITFNGKLVTALDSILIGPNDFQTLTNMRYTDTHVKAIPGMTKINTDAATYPNVVDMYYIQKSKYNEHHLVTQAHDANKTLLNITEMTNVIPATGNFSATVVRELIKPWVANTAKSVGDFVFPTTSNGYYYECVTAGTTHAATEPTWSTTEFALQTDGTVVWNVRSGDGTGTFSTSPSGNLVFCNGRENYIYSGNEDRVRSFLSINPNDSSEIKDYTDIINNTYADSNNVVTIPVFGGGIDAYTMGHWTFDNVLTDDSGNAHTLTNVGAMTFTTNTDQLLAGTHSAAGAGGSYGSRDITGDADFNLSASVWTISIKTRLTSLAASRSLWGFYKDGTNYAGCYVDTNGAIHFYILTASSTVVSVVTDNNTISVNQKHTVEVSLDASDNYYIFVDGHLKVTVNDAQKFLADYITFYAGLTTVIGNPFVGTIDELKIDKGICRHTSDYIAQSSAFSATTSTSVFIGSSQCINRIKIYVKTANTTNSTSVVYYWDGNSWEAATGLTDGTSATSKSLAQTGILTWDSVENLSKQKIVNNNLAFWTKIDFGTIDATVVIYMVTNGFNFQKIRDAWDGNVLNVPSFMHYTTTYTDYSINIYEEDYDSNDAGTYASIGATTSSQYIIIGFNQRVMGLKFIFVAGKVNTTAATIMSIDYYNGSSWTGVSGSSDGTSNDNISFAKNGTVSWDRLNYIDEKQYTPNNETPMYYYKISFDKTLSADVYIDNIVGIPVQEDLNGYMLPIKWLNSLFLCGERYGYGNKIIGSEPTTDSVFSGYNSFEGYLGDQDDILAGCTLYARYSSALHETLLLLKQNSTWLLDGSSFDNIVSYQISKTYGISAPKTLQVCDLGYEIAEGINKAVAIWQTNTCIMMFDNNSLIEISQDIENLFTNMYNTSVTERINYLYSNKSTSFYDPVYKEWHWLFCGGTSTTINTEYVYDIARKKWYKVDRGTKDLRCGIDVHDTKGNKYSYGALSTGYVERLNYGNTFDNDNIVCTLRTPDKPLGETIEYEGRERVLKIIGMVSTSTATVSVTHYADTETTGKALNSITQSGTVDRVNLSNRRIYQHKDQINRNAVFHSIKMTISSSDSECCFEPLVMAYLKKNTRNDVR